MNNLSIDDILQNYFTAENLKTDPAPLRKSLHMIGEWLKADRENPWPAIGFEDLKKQLGACDLPVAGMRIEALLDDLEKQVFSNSIQLNHPKYIGHMTQALPWISLLAEAFIATLNQNQVKIETAYISTLIEKQVMAWIHKRVYRFDEAFYRDAFHSVTQPIGNMVNGGTMGNLTALSVALERQLPGTRKEGLLSVLQQSNYRGFAVLGSSRIHYSLKKAMATLGLGENAICIIPTDKSNRIDLELLENTIHDLKQRRIKILAIVGIAGTTETGSIDPLYDMGKIAQREKIWFHVDAAWGGALLLADHFKEKYHGIEMADSLVIDGHKLFWVAMAQSMVLFKDSASLNCLKHNANYIIRDASGDLGQTSLEGSRRFDALKLWLSFKLLGLKGYETLLNQCSALSKSMRDLIQEDPDFELISESDTFILTYRYVPQDMQEDLHRYMSNGQFGKIGRLNDYLNGLNESLQDEQKNGGVSFVSRTLLESTPYPGEIVVLRVILTNVLTTAAHLREILDEQRMIGRRLADELEPRQRRAS